MTNSHGSSSLREDTHRVAETAVLDLEGLTVTLVRDMLNGNLNIRKWENDGLEPGTHQLVVKCLAEREVSDLRAALLDAVASLEELAAAWPQGSLPAGQVCVRMANAVNNGNAVIARTRTANSVGISALRGNGPDTPDTGTGTEGGR